MISPQHHNARSNNSFSLRAPRAWGAIASLVLLAIAEPISAQEIADVRVGFTPLSANAPTHKVGFWTPVAIKLKGASSAGRYALTVEADDSEDCAVATRVDVDLGASEEKTIAVDVKPGRTRGDLHVTLSTSAGQRLARSSISTATGELGDYLYLNVGAKIDALADALEFREKRAADEGKSLGRPVRFALYQESASTPLGFDGIDLILSTGAVDKNMLDWVKRGGRLIVAVDPERPLDPALGAKEPRKPAFSAKSLVPIEAWAGLQNKPFPARGEPPVKIARLQPADFGFDSWDVLVKLDDKSAVAEPLPLIARASYGFGALTVVAFSLDSGAFPNWSGRQEFLRALVDQIGPRYVPEEKTKSASWRPETSIDDWGAQLQVDLDNFDVPAWSFAAVALAMLGYILLVSAGDYFILRRALHRLETTWVTLPLIVIGISVAAYCALETSAERGERVNQISLLDFDLRSARDVEWRRMLMHGSTFFTMRSDRIRRLDVKVDDASDLDPWRAVAPTVSWFGRADDGPGGIGRAGGHGLSAKAYESPIGHAALLGVPMAYRATRSFTATWLPTQDRAGRLFPDLGGAERPPISADLAYHSREAPLKVSGTIQSDLPFDLEEASLFIFDRVYPLSGGLKKGETRRVEIKEIDSGILPSDWKAQENLQRPVTAFGRYDPGVALKNIMFHERLDPSLKVRDHLLRRLDWSWRLREDPRVLNVPLSSLGVRDAILVGRVKFETGVLGSLQNDKTPARLDLGAEGATLWRDTYLRAILPMRPGQ